MLLQVLFTSTLIQVFHRVQCAAHGLHLTPPMGWSSWNTFSSNFYDEKDVREIVDAIIRLELDKYGYNIITIDDFWQLPTRDEAGNLQVNAERFPSGMKNLSDYIHEVGLQFGIYSDAGDYTCGKMAGSLGHEETDVNLFLSWNIDYLKYDNCYPKGNETNFPNVNVDLVESFKHLPSFYSDPPERDRFEPMWDAIMKVSHIRNITVELCLYGWGNVEEWGPETGHLWRTGYDITDNWESVLRNIDRNDEDRFLGSQGPDKGWNYPDALFIQSGGMTETEYRTMFALWCVVKAPLMIGSDLRNMTKDDYGYKILTNEDLIAVNQDPLGVQATCVKDCCKGNFLGLGNNVPQLTCFKHFRNSWQIWTGNLDQDAKVVLIINRFDEKKFVNMSWTNDAKIDPGVYWKRNLWTHEEELINITLKTTLIDQLQAHDTFVFKLSPFKRSDAQNSLRQSENLLLIITFALTISMSFYT